MWKVIIIVLAFMLTGCNTTELEERCFPMLVAVGYEDGKMSYCAEFPKETTTGQGDAKSTDTEIARGLASNFEVCKKEYESRLNKEADYNHLKVVVLEDDLVENQVCYEDMLGYLTQTEEFPRNTYVCIVDDVEDLLEMKANLSQDLGTYLEEYLEKHEKKKDRLLTLGDLMDEIANQEMVLYIPYLEVEDNYVEWKGYMNNFGKSWQEFN